MLTRIPPTLIESPRPIRLLKVNDVAEITQVSPSQIYSLIQEGILPAVRFGTAIRVRPEDLDEYILEHLTVNG